jgi:hypothetical protein
MGKWQYHLSPTHKYFILKIKLNENYILGGFKIQWGQPRDDSSPSFGILFFKGCESLQPVREALPILFGRL